MRRPPFFLFFILILFHYAWIEIREDPETAEATMEGLP